MVAQQYPRRQALRRVVCALCCVMDPDDYDYVFSCRRIGPRATIVGPKRLRMSMMMEMERIIP